MQQVHLYHITVASITAVSGGVYGTMNYNEEYLTQTGTGSSQSNQGSHAAKWGVLSGGSQASRGSHQNTLKDVLETGPKS